MIAKTVCRTAFLAAVLAFPALAQEPLSLSLVANTSLTASWSTPIPASGYVLQVASDDAFTASSGSGTTTSNAVLTETFTDFTSAASVDISSSLDNYTQTSGWTGYKVFNATNQVKLGSGSTNGYLITPSLDLSAASSAFLAVFISKYGKDPGTVDIDVSSDGGSNFTTLDTITPNATSTEYTYTIPASQLSATTKFRFITSVKRCQIQAVTVYAATSSGSSGSILQTIPLDASATSVVVSGLSASTTYYFRIVDASDNAWSSIASATTRATAPVAPAWTSGNWSTLAVSLGDTASLDLSTYLSGDPAPALTLTSGSGTLSGTTWSFTPAAAGSYSATLEAVNEWGTASVTLAITVTDLSASVPVLTLSDPTTNSFLAAWTACDGSPTYTLQVATDDSFSTAAPAGTTTLAATTNNALAAGWSYFGSASNTGTYHKLVGADAPALISPAFSTMNVSTTKLHCGVATYGQVTADIKLVTASYSLDNGTTWILFASNNAASSGSTYVDFIPEFPAAALSQPSVRLKIAAPNATAAAGARVRNIYVSAQALSAASLVGEYTTSSTNLVVPDLARDTTYYARVNAGSDWSTVKSITTLLASPDSPPTLFLSPADTAVSLTVGDTFTIVVSTTEYDGDPISLVASSLPSGATFSAVSGTSTVSSDFSFTPSAAGTYSVTFTATDKDGSDSATVSFTVADEPAGTLAFESATLSVSEGAGALAVTVRRSGGANGAVTVDYATSAGTATSSSDFTPTSGTLSFANGVISQFFSIPILDDATAESPETFYVELSNPAGGATLGAPSSLTVTINDNDDANADYYADCYNSDGSLKTGTALKNALSAIINRGVTTNSYGSNLDTILRTIDACPTNSSQVLGLYLQRGISSFNKEHIWAQSHGIEETVPAYSDLHHIRATDSTMNSTRGNLDFDNCYGVSGYKEKNGCYYTSTAWEPPNSAKGDVARALFYMDVRYDGTHCRKNNDLELVDSVGTSTTGNTLGKLSTLLEWNELDPVDSFETNRNERIYKSYQKNRNPFIDHPEWVRAVFDPDNFVTTWTLTAVVNGEGYVAPESYPTVTNGTSKVFNLTPVSYYYISSVYQNSTLINPENYTNRTYYAYTWYNVTNNGTLTVNFSPILAALGTPQYWLNQYGGTTTDFDAAELADWNGDGIPNWQEYRNGTDPTAIVLAVPAPALDSTTATSATFSWSAVEDAASYEYLLTQNDAGAPTTLLSESFENGIPDTWTATSITRDSNRADADGTYALVFNAADDALVSPPVTNPASISFMYERSSSTVDWLLLVQASTSASGPWTTLATVSDATTAWQTNNIDASAFSSSVTYFRLLDARTEGIQERYVDLVQVLGAPSAEPILSGTTASTDLTLSPLAGETTYSFSLRALDSTTTITSRWSSAITFTTPTDGPAPQTITLADIPPQVATNSLAFSALATASSGLPLTYAISGPAVLSNDTLSFTGAGTVSITFSQAGNEDYAAAADATLTFAVTKAPAIVTLSGLSQTADGTAKPVTATTDPAGLSVNITYDGTSAAPSAPGTYAVVATIASDLYEGSASATLTLLLATPDGLAASAITDASFTASWSAVPAADSYLLTVYSSTLSDPAAVLAESFETATTAELPEGWTASSSGFAIASRTLDGYKAAAFSANGAYLVTPPVTNPATLTFLYARSSNTNAWSLDVQSAASTNGPWTTLTSITNATTTVQTNTTDLSSFSGTCYLRFLDTRTATNSAAVRYLDAITVTAYDSAAEPLTGYNSLPVSGTSITVADLTHATEYTWQVAAVSGSTTSLWSSLLSTTTTKHPQAITVAPVSDQLATNTLTFSELASASSGLELTYAISGPATLTGDTLSFTGAGTVTITFSQAGDADYLPAEDASLSFAVTKAPATVTLSDLTQTYDGSAKPVTVTTDPADLPVTIIYDGSATAPTAPGTYAVAATIVSDLYDGSASGTLTILPATADGLVASEITDSSFLASWSAVANADSYLIAVSPDNTPIPVTTTSYLVSNLTHATTYTWQIAAISGSVTSDWSTAVSTTTTKHPQAITVAPVSDQLATNTLTFSELASASSGLELTYAISGPATLTGDTLSFTGAGTVTITFSQAGDADYLPAEDASLSFAVTKAPATVTLSDLTQTYDGTAKPVTVTTDPADLPVAITYDGSSFAPINAGTYAAVATIVSDLYAGTASDILTIAPASQTLFFDPIPDQDIDSGSIILNASASSGLEVVYALDAASPAMLDGATLTFTATGTVSVTASQPGNNNWLAAEAVMRTFAITSTPAVILTPYEQWITNQGLDLEAYPESTALATDGDGDGVSNWGEYIADTDPSDATVYLRWSGATWTADLLTLTPAGISTNRAYTLMVYTNLLSPPTTNDLGMGATALTLSTNVPAHWFGTLRVTLPPE